MYKKIEYKGRNYSSSKLLFIGSLSTYCRTTQISSTILLIKVRIRMFTVKVYFKFKRTIPDTSLTRDTNIVTSRTYHDKLVVIRFSGHRVQRYTITREEEELDFKNTKLSKSV